MADKWKKVKIGEVAQVFDGPHATPNKTLSGPIFLGINCLSKGRLDLSNTEHLSECDFVKWTRRVIPSAGDVVFSYETRIGEAAIIPEGLQCCLGRRMALVRVDRRQLDPQFFLYQYLSPSFQDFLRSRTIHGSTVDRLALKDFPNFPIAMPPLEEQRRIAHILGTLDDKIELNRLQNETLESLARALFQSWFVDFDPVRAKASGETEAAICQRLGLSPQVLALFPAALEESALGEVPVGWRIGGLGEVVSIFDSKRIPLSSRQREVRKGPYPYYGAAAIMDNVDDYLFDGVYILTGEDGSVLNSDGTPIIQYVWGKFWVNNHAHVLKGANGLSDEHLFIALKSANISAFVNGAVQAKLNQANLKKIPLMLADNAVMQSYGDIIKPLFDCIRSNTEESRTLAALRDELLPRLLSGELSAAALTEEVYG